MPDNDDFRARLDAYMRSPEYNGTLSPGMRAEMAAHRDARQAKRKRAYYVRSKYGIAKADFHAMQESQGNRCLTCNRHESEFTRALCVDHDHVTGKVRGLICSPCNLILGYAQESPQVLRSLATYLEYFSQTGGTK